MLAGEKKIMSFGAVFKQKSSKNNRPTDIKFVFLTDQQQIVKRVQYNNTARLNS